MTRSLASFHSICPNHLNLLLRWFGLVKRKDDNDWVKRCIILTLMLTRCLLCWISHGI